MFRFGEKEIGHLREDLHSLSGLDGRETEFRFPAGANALYLLHSIQTGSEAHPASCPMSNGGSVPGTKETEG
jgi:hypothetical protein